ncbi:MAG: Spy/CpxP family protein refolding chaperone [Halothiobacillaceae bacterium]
MKHKLLTAAILGLSLVTAPLYAAPARELSAPIIELIPIVKKMTPELNLSAEQQAKLKTWMDSAPAKRQALEAEVLDMRKQLRAAILSGANDTVRQDLLKQIGQKETELLTMRSKCGDFVRELLTPAQYTQVREAYEASLTK